MKENSSPPVALTIAGSDSSSGAGLQADLKTFAAHGVYGVNALTATVAEVPGEVAQFAATDSTLLGHQLNSVNSHFPIAAAKTGMLANEEIVAAVADFMAENPDIHFVVDPVIFATADARLLSEAGVEEMQTSLLPKALLVTPNLMEAEALLGSPIANEDDLAAAPHRLFDRYGTNFLVKGGHFSESDDITDYLWLSGDTIPFSHPRLDIPDTHGTGCTLSAAITARLARGGSLDDAVGSAVEYLTDCLRKHHRWTEAGIDIAALNHFPDGLDCRRP